MSFLKRNAILLVVVVLAAVAAITIFTGGDDGEKTLTAYFPRAVSLYEGSDVRVLGVAVGKVDTVTPVGTQVKVEMHYDDTVDIPSNARAVIVSPAIVGDRYVQLTPVFKKGDDTLPDNTVLKNEVDANGDDRNEVPLELDQIFSSLDRLNVALGPNGANSKGALSDLLQVTANNFNGQGAQFHTTIKNFSRLSQTLDDNKEELFGSTRKLSKFINTLADNDNVVRGFNDSLGRVSTELAGERQELAGALKNLAVALDEVGSFVKDNRQVLTDDIGGLNRVFKVLAKRRSSLDQVLRIAPVALNNLALTYNPDAGTLDTNANINQLITELTENPKDVLCALVSANDNGGRKCDTIQGLPGLPRSSPFGQGTGTSYAPSDPSLGGLVGVSGR